MAIFQKIQRNIDTNFYYSEESIQPIFLSISCVDSAEWNFDFNLGRLQYLKPAISI
jgi:hypothetical protein